VLPNPDLEMSNPQTDKKQAVTDEMMVDSLQQADNDDDEGDFCISGYVPLHSLSQTASLFMLSFFW
jgi:hypothetical protein